MTIPLDTVGEPFAPRPPRIDLTAALGARLRRSTLGPLLATREATVVFVPGRGQPATVELHHGHLLVRRGEPRTGASARVSGSAEVLDAIIGGRDSGIRAFLAGEVTVRGDLAITLALDGLFDPAVDAPARYPVSGQVTAHGVATAYLDAGPRDAPPVLMLHGLGATNASLLPLMWDLAQDHRVVVPDLPGFGASAAPKGSYSAGWFVPWIESFMSAVDVRRPALLGNSMGGRIVLEYALQRPAHTGPVIGLCFSPAFRRLRQWVPAVRLLPVSLAAPRLPFSHAMVVRGIRLMFSQPERLPPSWYDAAADEFLRVGRDRAHRLALISSMRQIYLDDPFSERGFWTRLPGLEPPALFLWGARDRLVPSKFARHVSTALPEATSLVLDDCGHVPQFEHPDRVSELVREFLVANPPG